MSTILLNTPPYSSHRPHLHTLDPNLRSRISRHDLLRIARSAFPLWHVRLCICFCIRIQAEAALHGEEQRCFVELSKTKEAPNSRAPAALRAAASLRRATRHCHGPAMGRALSWAGHGPRALQSAERAEAPPPPVVSGRACYDPQAYKARVAEVQELRLKLESSGADSSRVAELTQQLVQLQVAPDRHPFCLISYMRGASAGSTPASNALSHPSGHLIRVAARLTLPVSKEEREP